MLLMPWLRSVSPEIVSVVAVRSRQMRVPVGQSTPAPCEAATWPFSGGVAQPARASSRDGTAARPISLTFMVTRLGS
jgi:hypothetical protein